MESLTITKKAANEADAKKLLDALYVKSTVFGVPTVFYYIKDYASQEEWMCDVEKRAFASVNKSFTLSQKDKVFLVTCLNGLTNHLSFTEGRLKVENKINHNNNIFAYRANNKNICINLVSRPSREYNFFHPEIINMHRDGFPSTSSQLQYFVSMHEAAHGIYENIVVASNEAHVDMIASIMSRKSFENASFVSAMADERMIMTIFAMNSASGNEKYGMPCVEAIDYTTNLPEQTIERITEKDLKNICKQDFNFLNNSIYKITNKLKAIFPPLFEISDIKAFMVAAHVLNKNLSDEKTKIALAKKSSKLKFRQEENSKQRKIAMRFLVACSRIHFGENAYLKGNNLIPEKWLESERDYKTVDINSQHYLPIPDFGDGA